MNNDSYVCTECINVYILDEETHLSKQYLQLEGTVECYFENIGTKLNPIYSCINCYNITEIT